MFGTNRKSTEAPPKARIPDHLRERFGQLDSLPIAAPPVWRLVAHHAVGGLTEVGFADGSDFLLVLSSSGRGVIDALSGDRLARDDSENYPFEVGSLSSVGIGPLEGMSIRMSGLSGGGLPNGTDDGWSVERHPLAWPDEELFLSEPGHTMLWSPAGRAMAVYRLGNFVTEIRAFGFSPTGKSFVVATSSDLITYGR